LQALLVLPTVILLPREQNERLACRGLPDWKKQDAQPGKDIFQDQL